MMFSISNFGITILPLLTLALLGWLISLKNDNVTIVDTLWALFFLLTTVVSFYFFSIHSQRAYLILGLVLVWSLRLSIYLHLRNHKKEEDHRYKAIRNRNEPNFRIKSLYLVFVLQAVLAWVISLPLIAAIGSANPLNWLDMLGVILWLIGIIFQVIGDYQLVRFKQNPKNKNKVLMTGVWRYTRHPNYFGESCIWFGYGLIGVGAGYAWVIISPVMMTYLLVNVTGASLLENDITERRPDYAKYIKQTNRFFPWFPKKMT
jgi:steroid 5-alpha reductase family enzyme